MRLSSDDVPVTVTSGATKKGAGSKVYLFNDVLVVVQVTHCTHAHFHHVTNH